MPPELLPEEDPGAFFPQRLGLNDVIERQVRQFRRLARLHRRVEAEKVRGLLGLIARRSDAEDIFTAAGRELAGQHFAGATGWLRRISRKLPQPLRERAALRAIRTAHGTLLIAADLEIEPTPLEIRATDALTARIPAEGTACQLYAALASCLLELSGAGRTEIFHTECQGRGDDRCVWRAGSPSPPPPAREEKELQWSSVGST